MHSFAGFRNLDILYIKKIAYVYTLNRISDIFIYNISNITQMDIFNHHIRYLNILNILFI